MTDRLPEYAYVYTTPQGYEHLCIDEGTAGLYTGLESMYTVEVIWWDDES